MTYSSLIRRVEIPLKIWRHELTAAEIKQMSKNTEIEEMSVWYISSIAFTDNVHMSNYVQETQYEYELKIETNQRVSQAKFFRMA